MRDGLDKLYRWSGAVSGLCIVLICLIILARVVGRWFGVAIPSSEDLAGYLLASASFLALAYAFRQGAHIRVSLFTQRLGARYLRIVESLVLLFASVLSVYLSYQLGYMVYESWLFDDVTHGYIPMPLWLVQFPTALGALLFAVSVVDTSIRYLTGAEAIPASDEEQLVQQNTISGEGQ